MPVNYASYLKLDRLLNRRVVRIGLRLAEMFKPLVRLVKR